MGEKGIYVCRAGYGSSHYCETHAWNLLPSRRWICIRSSRPFGRSSKTARSELDFITATASLFDAAHRERCTYPE